MTFDNYSENQRFYYKWHAKTRNVYFISQNFAVKILVKHTEPQSHSHNKKEKWRLQNQISSFKFSIFSSTGWRVNWQQQP